MVFFIRIFYDSCSSCLSFDSFFKLLIYCLVLYFICYIFCQTFIFFFFCSVLFFLFGYFLFSFFVFFFLIFLSRRLQNVYAYTLLGISFGQLLFDVLLHKYLFQEKIGTTAFFIQITLVILLVIAIRSYYALSIIISRFMTKSTL